MLARVVSFVFLASFLCQSGALDPGVADPADAPPVLTCPAGAPLGGISLRVKSPKYAETLPLPSINHLSEGDTVLYSPVLRGTERRGGEVALVLISANRSPGREALIVTDPTRADRPHEWPVGENISLAAFVYGPQGLSKKRVAGFLSQDDQLVAQLADYAEKTTQTEALLQALSDNSSSAASMNAALSGFASQYGLAVQIDKNATPTVQAQTLFATLNPQLAAYNPIGTNSNAQRIGQTASVAAAAATLFFGSPIGLAAGGTAMVLDLRSIAFPGTQFRSSFAQPERAGLHLCGQRGPLPPHTRVAYIWALRIPNTGVPSLTIGPANHLPLGLKSALPVDAPNLDWKYLQRARNWSLEDQKGRRTPLKVLKIGTERELEIDLQSVAVEPGEYRLVADWDWKPFSAAGPIYLRALSDLRDTQFDPASQNALIARNGKIPATVRNGDFEFTVKVEIKKSGDEFATAEPVRFLLPKGPRLGPQESMDVQIDTASLNPGPYSLLITQQDGVAHPVNFRVLPPSPRFDNLPILVNQGAKAQHYVLKGERLDLLAQLTAPNAVIDLGQASPNGNERDIAVRLSSSPAPGISLPLQAVLADRTAPLPLADALQIAGPLPVIASSKLSGPPDIGISIRSDEFPAGHTLTAVLDVRNINAKSELHMNCAEDVGRQPVLRIGYQDSISNLQPLSGDQLFLSYDTSAFPSGCTLRAVLDNGRAGRSQPFVLTRLVRFPKIVSLTATNSEAPVGSRVFELTGDNLEMISQLSWDKDVGTAVTNLPVAIPGQGQRQNLLITLPDAAKPQSALFLWMRGEAASRATTVLSPLALTSLH